MRTLLGIAAALVLLATPSPSNAHPGGHHDHHPSPGWKSVDVGTDQQLRGLDATDRRHAWVGGSKGGVWKTSDGGKTWTDVSPPGASALLFRDVEILRPGHVLVLAIGEADASRIYRTADGGATWTQTFTNDDPAAFYDCMAMWPGGKRGIAMSDPVDGKFRIIETSDGGASWSLVDPAGMPPAVDGEFGFAASGTCLVTAGASGRVPRVGWYGVADLPLPRPWPHLDRGRLDHPRGGRVAARSPCRSARRDAGWRSAATSPSRTTALTCRRTRTTAGSRGPTAATSAATGPASTG